MILKQRLADADAPFCVAVGVVRDETTLSFGCSEGIDPAPIDKDTLFEIGSISKGLTGLLLVDMVRKGEVTLDDPASKFSRPGAQLPTRSGRQITLRNLVTHAAGLPFNPPNRQADYDANALYAALARTQLDREIGAASVYSNFGFMWLSDLLGRVGGKPFDVLRERVLAPLGMTSTTVRLAPAAEVRRAAGHNVAEAHLSTWSSDESKREFLDRTFASWQRSDKGKAIIGEMAIFLADQTSFPDLRNWEDSVAQ